MPTSITRQRNVNYFLNWKAILTLASNCVFTLLVFLIFGINVCVWYGSKNNLKKEIHFYSIHFHCRRIDLKYPITKVLCQVSSDSCFKSSFIISRRQFLNDEHLNLNGCSCIDVPWSIFVEFSLTDFFYFPISNSRPIWDKIVELLSFLEGKQLIAEFYARFTFLFMRVNRQR